MNEQNTRHLRRMNIIMNQISQKEVKTSKVSVNSKPKPKSKNLEVGPYIGPSDLFLKKIFK